MTTNEKLSEVLEALNELYAWAMADAEHSYESDAPVQARDDRRRAKRIKLAFKILQTCDR